MCGNRDIETGTFLREPCYLSPIVKLKKFVFPPQNLIHSEKACFLRFNRDMPPIIKYHGSVLFLRP